MEKTILTADVQATADGVSSTATVTVYLNDLFDLEEDKEALQRILEANQCNTLGWDLSGNLQQLQGVSLINNRVKGIWFKQNQGVTVFLDVALYYLNELEDLRVENNDVEELNFPEHSKIQYLAMNNRKLTTLYVSMLGDLVWIVCLDGDSLVSINLKNRNDTNFSKVGI